MAFSLTADLLHPLAPPDLKGLYCYDDLSVDVVCEPLVQATTAFIIRTLEDVGYGTSYAPHRTVQLNFTDAEIPREWKQEDWPVVRLTYVGSSNGGSDYLANQMHPYKVTPGGAQDFVWLCSHLCDYFEEPPQTFYAQITALPVSPYSNISKQQELTNVKS